jgi:hypothetical protein
MKRNITEEEVVVNTFLETLKDKKYTLDTRIRLLIACITNYKADWKKLEVETDISAEKWRQYIRGSTKASIEMAEALALKWPQYAFWLITGVSDEKHGHLAPNEEWGFPNTEGEKESHLEFGKNVNHYEKTTSFFRLAAQLAREVWESSNPMKTLNENYAFAKWHTTKGDKNRFKGNVKLLMTLYELKEDEFLSNNLHLEMTEVSKNHQDDLNSNSE